MSPNPTAQGNANEQRRARAAVRGEAAKIINALAKGEEVSPERFAEASLMDLATIAFNLGYADKATAKDRITAHQIIQERLLGKPTQKTESESVQRFVFEGPDWWFNRNTDELATDKPKALRPGESV
jgi:hypothetical protein